MGTPLKSLPVLLSPRLLSPLSPLSPKLLSVPRKYENFIKFKHSFEEIERTKNVAKKLEFPRQIEDPVQIKITHCTTESKDFEINTPNKNHIFENGLRGDQSHTLLGVGAFGRVVRGIHQGKTVAVKVVRNASILGEKNALNLNHDNIVRTLDIIQNKDGNYSLIVMEYFPNSKQLQTVLEDSDFEMEDRIINFAVDICNGLNFIHEAGILHLDIKPQNILVADNICRICDFGNSVLKTETESFNHQGTVVYSAPELLQGKVPSEKCDVYSLGILLWQLKSRCPPYCEVDNTETVVYKVVKCNWRPENVDPVDDYSRLYQACWQAEPHNRPCVKNVLLNLKCMC